MPPTHGSVLACPVDLSEDQLLEEISWYESRLAEIAAGDESAYEKAFARFYELALLRQRERLATQRRLRRLPAPQQVPTQLYRSQESFLPQNV